MVLTHGDFSVVLGICEECRDEKMECRQREAEEEESRKHVEIEYEVRRRHERYERDLGPRYARYRWDSAPASLQESAEAETAFDWVASGARGSLLLYGNVGAGKTGLAVCLGRELLKRGHAVRFWVVRDLLDEMRRAFEEPNDAETCARDAGVLLVDDLGTERSTPFALERLLSLIDHRYRYELPTIVTSNYAPSALIESFDADVDIGRRIVSRLVEDATKISFTGPDLRVGKAESSLERRAA